MIRKNKNYVNYIVQLLYRKFLDLFTRLEDYVYPGSKTYIDVGNARENQSY